MNKNDYETAIKEYEKGCSARVESILKMLSKQQYVKYDDDINYFISVVQNIAKRNNDSTIISYTKQVGNKISTRDGNNHGYTSSHENVLTTENECIIVIKKSLINDEFDVAINNIIKFIRKERHFHTALAVLQTIDQINIQSYIFTKKDVALLFIEKMYKVIISDVKPKEEGTLVKKYTSEWSNFSSKDFLEYQKLKEKYTDQYTIKQIMEYISKNDKKLINERIQVEQELQKEKEYLAYKKKIFPYTVQGCSSKLIIDSVKYNGISYAIKFEFKITDYYDKLQNKNDNVYCTVDNDGYPIKCKSLGFNHYFVEFYKRDNDHVILNFEQGHVRSSVFISVEKVKDKYYIYLG